MMQLCKPICAARTLRCCFQSDDLVWIGLPDAFCKNTGHFNLSTVSDLICVVIRKRLRENRATVSIVKTQLIICLYSGWLITFLCVRDTKISPTIASIAANKLRWKNCPDKIHYQGHYNLRNSALVFSKLRQIIYFQNIGFRHWFSKYRPFTGLC